MKKKTDLDANMTLGEMKEKYPLEYQELVDNVTSKITSPFGKAVASLTQLNGNEYLSVSTKPVS